MTSRHRAQWTKHVEGSSATPQRSGNFTKGKGRIRPGEMNRTETAYAQHLELRKHAGEVLWWGFEAVTIKLASDVRLSPDFAVLLADGSFELHDTKGTTKVKRKSGERVAQPFIEDAARIKMKVAAQQFPLIIKVVFKVDGNWIEKEY